MSHLTVQFAQTSTQWHGSNTYINTKSCINLANGLDSNPFQNEAWQALG